MIRGLTAPSGRGRAREESFMSVSFIRDRRRSAWPRALSLAGVSPFSFRRRLTEWAILALGLVWTIEETGAGGAGGAIG